MIDKFYITTYGRADKQITWNNLPEIWKDRTWLVVQDREKDLYTSYPRVKVLPKRIKTLSPTRKWLIRKSKKFRFALFDDDLEFFNTKAYGEKGTSNWKMEGNDFEKLEKEIDNWFDKGYIHCAMGAVLNQPRGVEYDDNFRMCMNIFYNGPKVPFSKVRWDRLKCSQDFDCNLQLLRLGYMNRVFTRYRVGQKTTAAPGGCQSYRTIRLHNQCMQELNDYHSEFVQLRTKVESGTGEWKGQEKIAATIFWKKAYDSSPHRQKEIQEEKKRKEAAIEKKKQEEKERKEKKKQEERNKTDIFKLSGEAVHW